MRGHGCHCSKWARNSGSQGRSQNKENQNFKIKFKHMLEPKDCNVNIYIKFWFREYAASERLTVPIGDNGGVRMYCHISFVKDRITKEMLGRHTIKKESFCHSR